MLTLRCTYTGAVPVEAPCVAPDRLAALSAAAIARLPVLHGNRAAVLGDFFTVTGDPADADILIKGDCNRVKWLGADMAGGRLTVRGDAGTHLGSGLTGGTIDVHGHADDWVGAEMRGGLIRVRGSAGDHAGAAYPGSRRGMRGGKLLIHGDAGDELGAVMRRGLIAVGGRVGAFAAAAMVAGSIFAFGPVGPHAAAGMKRGTLAAFGPGPELLPTFRYDCTYRPAFIDLYLRRLAALRFGAPAAAGGSFRRYRGDLVALGLGEVLISAA
ncbi:MAG TPA: formylmethanofuran dehydrogenase subunit C [Gemmataceae bacterium]|jgi:formylmethanofuran dehydrogenase subunit C